MKGLRQVPDIDVERHNMNRLEAKMKGVSTEEIGQNVRKQQRAIYGNTLLKSRNIFGRLPFILRANDAGTVPVFKKTRRAMTRAATTQSAARLSKTANTDLIKVETNYEPLLGVQRGRTSLRNCSSCNLSGKKLMLRTISRFQTEGMADLDSLCSPFAFHQPEIFAKYFTANLIK